MAGCSSPFICLIRQIKIKSSPSLLREVNPIIAARVQWSAIYASVEWAKRAAASKRYPQALIFESRTNTT